MTDRSRGAGAILDLTVHTADAIRFLCGREVTSVFGHAAAAGFGSDAIEGAVAGSMRLEGGVLASFADAYSALPARSVVEVHGESGSLRGRGILDGGSRATIEHDDGRALQIRDDPYLRTVERFAAAIRGTGEPAATGLDGRRSLAVALALRTAVAEGGSIALDAPAVTANARHGAARREP